MTEIPSGTRSITALDLPEGYYAIPDPHTPGQVTYWRRRNVKTRSGGTRCQFTAWPPKARYGPMLSRDDVPADLRGVERREWLLAWWRTHRAPYDNAVVAAIAADPIAAGRRFAELMTRCCQCCRALTDALSKTYGIGPECRAGIPADVLARYFTPEVGRAHANFDLCDEPRWEDCAACVRVMERTERALKAATPIIAEQARREERARIAEHLRTLDVHQFVDNHPRLHAGTSITAVVDALADQLALPADVTCPNSGCGGVFPGDGPGDRVCRCGSWWATGDAREAVTA